MIAGTGKIELSIAAGVAIGITLCKNLCHKRAMRFEPMRANTRFFDTLISVLPCGPDLWQAIEFKSGLPENRS